MIDKVYFQPGDSVARVVIRPDPGSLFIGMRPFSQNLRFLVNPSCLKRGSKREQLPLAEDFGGRADGEDLGPPPGSPSPADARDASCCRLFNLPYSVSYLAGKFVISCKSCLCARTGSLIRT